MFSVDAPDEKFSLLRKTVNAAGKCSRIGAHRNLRAMRKICCGAAQKGSACGVYLTYCHPRPNVGTNNIRTFQGEQFHGYQIPPPPLHDDRRSHHGGRRSAHHPAVGQDHQAQAAGPGESGHPVWDDQFHLGRGRGGRQKDSRDALGDQARRRSRPAGHRILWRRHRAVSAQSQGTRRS